MFGFGTIYKLHFIYEQACNLKQNSENHAQDPAGVITARPCWCHRRGKEQSPALRASLIVNRTLLYSAYIFRRGLRTSLVVAFVSVESLPATCTAWLRHWGLPHDQLMP